MKARSLVIAVCALVVLAIPGVAFAKGPSQARLEGPGLAGPVTVRGEGEPGSRGNLAELAALTGLFPAMFAETPNPMSATRPAGALGPRYVVTYVVPSGTGQDEIRQDVYPYAETGPLTYTRPGQRFFGDQATLGGWFRSPAQLVTALVSLGVPAERSAAVAAVGQPRRSGSSDPAGETSSAWLVVVAVAGLLALTGAGLAVRQRRSHRATGAGD